MAHPYFDVPIPTVLGHRGAAGVAPENTLLAFARGLEQGAHILESDVHQTRDGVLVLIHDDTVDRTTDGHGRVAELRLEELRRLDAGYRFEPEPGAGFPFRGQGLRIPTLEEAFARFPGVRMNLELKEGLPGLVEQTVDLVVKAGREPLVLLAAEDDAVMARLRACLAERGAAPAVGASRGDVLRFLQAAMAGESPPPGPMALQIPPDHQGQPLVTPELVGHAHAHGIFVHVWTINRPEEMQRLLDLGVDGLVTDFPQRAAQVIAARARAASRT